MVTDGHPDCVANQNVCIHINRSFRSGGDEQLQISSHLLKWSKCDQHHELADIIEFNKRYEHNCTCVEGKFDRIIAADCLFFRDFHEDLVWLLDAALAPDGVIYMLQPPRGNNFYLC